MKNTENKIKRRNRILDIAGKVFLKKGYADASMAEIAAAVGGSKATLYSYFPGKKELFQAFMLYETENRVPLVFFLPEDTSDVVNSLHELGIRFINLITDDTPIAIQRIAVHDAVRFPEVGRAFYEYGPKVSNRILSDYIRRAHKNGDIKAPNAQLAASQFIMLCQANDIVQSYMLGITGKPTAENIEYVVSAAVDTFKAAYVK